MAELRRKILVGAEAKRKALEGIVKKPAPAPKDPDPTNEETPAKPQLVQ